MTIQPYEPPVYDVVLTAGVDSWVPVLSAVGDLAAKIAGTDFVPEAMRGKPAAVAAAILAGREMGIGPMTALQNIHVIKGKPGQSAQLMRSLVLSAGHAIRFVETTDTRCVVEGKRVGEDEWERVTFTADQARRAKIDLGLYPEDKLVARATSRLCRRKFADCLAGMAYSIEELQDGDADDPPTPIIALPGPATPTRTAKRAAPKRTPTEPVEPSGAPPLGVTSASRAEAKAAPVDTVPPPPLPGEEDGPPPDDVPTDDGVTKPQLSKMHASFNDMGITDRADRLELTRGLLSRTDLTSANELTKAEASTLIDLLEQCGGEPDPLLAVRVLAGIGASDGEPALCPRCGGAGEICWNPTWNNDPRFEESRDCQDCGGTGVAEPEAS